MADASSGRTRVETEQEAADNWWWLVVRNPNQEIHLYELGEAAESDVLDEDGNPTGETTSVPLAEQRRTQILAELGASEGDLYEAGWDLSLAPGRPNRWIEPKAYDEAGELRPIVARAGVTLHLLPETEPGAPAPDEG
jgi:hypothetical protein